jgi:intracellular multiplication protein IcmE
MMTDMSDQKDDMNEDDFDIMDDESFDDLDDGAFDDFDETQKGSLKDIWQNNPMLKLAVVGLGIIVVVVAVFLFGNQEKEITSVVKSGSQNKELPSESELSPDMEQRIDEKNEFDYRLAEATGGSQIPISTNVPRPGLSPEDQEQNSQDDDPLAIWRSEALKREEVIPTEPEPVAIQPVAPPVQIAPARPQPNPEMVAALSNGFGAQMRQILGSKSITGTKHMQVTQGFERTIPVTGSGSLGGDSGDGAEGAASSSEMGADLPDLLASAGDIVYAQTLTEANTDAPGPVLAQIISGPMKGSRIIGGFAETEKFLTITFDRVVYEGRVVDVDAIAIDADTTLPGVITDIDNRYFKRVVLPAAAAFVEGFGEAVADSGSTTVSVEGETVTTETDDIDTREELLSGVSEATSVISEFMDEEADRTQPMLKVAAGTPIGIMFIDEVEDPNFPPMNN